MPHKLLSAEFCGRSLQKGENTASQLFRNFIKQLDFELDLK